MNKDKINEDFDKGFNHGLDSVDKSTYEGYLSNEVSLEWWQDRYQQRSGDLAEVNARILKATGDHQESLRQKQEKSRVFEEQQYLVDTAEQEIKEQRSKVEMLQEEKKVKSTPYPFLAGLLYFLAGGAFVAGDLIISREIVAYALNIRNNFEAWAFAVGLASLSVLLKPAYERLVEMPYLKNYNERTKKVYGYFQTFLLVVSVVTLSVLGWFRYEAYKTDKLKESINRQIKTMQLDATTVDASGQQIQNPAIAAKIEEKLKEYDQLNLDLVNSPWALFSFVLSGILFAIAGAICLGIAFPILQSYWVRWFQHNPAIWRARRKIKKRTPELTENKKKWFEAKTSLDYLAESSSLLPGLEELKTEKAEINKELSDIREKIKLSVEAIRVSSYSDGYNSGTNNRDDMTDEEFEDYRRRNIEKIRNQNPAGADKPQKLYRSNGLRPHQALRKAITDGFNEN